MATGTRRIRRAVAVAVCGTLLSAGAVLAAQTAQQKCDQARVSAWRTYVSCMEKVVAKEAGGVGGSYLQGFAKCRHKYFSSWAKLQATKYAGSTCIGSRFADNGDGTATDNLSGLVWEKKTDDSTIHDKDDSYTWSTGAPNAENGTAFTSFLATLNGGGGFAGANGWRLPTMIELQTIVLDFPCTGSSCSCPSSPCVEPALDAVTTQPDYHWSATSFVPSPDRSWCVDFSGGDPKVNYLTVSNHVRAVRGGL